MEVRTLELTIISAEGLKSASRSGNLRTYAQVWIDPSDRRTTTVDTDHGLCPSWNYTTSFTVPWFSFSHPAARLIVQIFHKRYLVPSVLLGNVTVPLADFARLPSSSRTTVCYQVYGPSGEPQGSLKLAVSLGPIRSIVADKPALAYPAFSNTIPPRKPKPQRYPNSSKVLPHGNPEVPYCAPPSSQGSGFGLGLFTGAVGGFFLGEASNDASWDSGGCSDGNFGGGGCSSTSWDSGCGDYGGGGFY